MPIHSPSQEPLPRAQENSHLGNKTVLIIDSTGRRLRRHCRTTSTIEYHVGLLEASPTVGPDKTRVYHRQRWRTTAKEPRGGFPSRGSRVQIPSPAPRILRSIKAICASPRSANLRRTAYHRLTTASRVASGPQNHTLTRREDAYTLRDKGTSFSCTRDSGTT